LGRRYTVHGVRTTMNEDNDFDVDEVYNACAVLELEQDECAYDVFKKLIQRELLPKVEGNVMEKFHLQGEQDLLLLRTDTVEPLLFLIRII
jgi:hypothetical protein